MLRPVLPLVFIGPMAAGKSKIGRLVARGLDVAFLDTDKLVVAEHGAIPAIFTQHGEEVFRGFERDAVKQALQSEAVVSLGGGAVLHTATQAELSLHTVILLTVSREAVAARLQGGGRPLLAASGTESGAGEEALSDAQASAAAVDRWESIARQRMPIYESLATAVFDTSGRPISQIAEDIVNWARKRP